MLVAPYLDTLLLLLVAAAAINDLVSRRIPNLLLLTGLVGALVLHAISPDPGAALLDCLGGAVLGLAVFLPFYLVRGMAAGDVKMMAVVGAFMGPEHTFTIAMLSWCMGGAMALGLLALRGRMRLALGNLRRILTHFMLPGGATLAAPVHESAGSLPYGVAIAAGTALFLLHFYG